MSKQGTKDSKKYILFDLDGTITDPMLGITKSVKYALEKFNIQVEDLNDLCKFIGPPLKDSFMEYYNFTECDAEKAINFYREYFSTEGLYENEVYDGFEELLISLKENQKTLIVATSKPTVFAKTILNHFELSNYFDLICGSNLDGTMSKKGDIIKYIIDEVKIENPSKMVMVGDRKHDIYGAIENKIDSIGVLYGYGDYEELSNSNSTYIVSNVNELKNLLETV